MHADCFCWDRKDQEILAYSWASFDVDTNIDAEMGLRDILGLCPSPGLSSLKPSAAIRATPRHPCRRELLRDITNPIPR